ncbi:MAG: hypothetical protein VW644_06645 [Alphaproteobacteria bacterium]|jgi:hypothetical protein
MFAMAAGIIIAIVSVCAGIGILLYALSLRGGSTGSRQYSKQKGIDNCALESLHAFLVGVNQNSESGENRQKLIRQCRPQDVVNLVATPAASPGRRTITVHRADGADLGLLPRNIIDEIAGYLDSGVPVTARVAEIDPFESKSGEMLKGMQIEITPHRTSSERDKA